MLVPALPAAPSWYPGHMSRFARILPAFLTHTDIVIELRDARLPLTSINPAFEGAIGKWRRDRRGGGGGGALCERIVVLGKKDLVAQWGIEPFRRAMQSRFPDQRVLFTSHTHPPTVRELHDTLVSIATQHAARTNNAHEVNVLVVGMPNVGKSTLLNALRTLGIPGPTPKALRTSAHPGLTRALSTRLKLSLDPLIYAFDSPGVMMPFLGRGSRGAERGVKLALIAGIKEGMYDIEALAAYLAYRLWILNPSSPVYMALLPPGTPPPADVHELLDSLAARLGMVRRGGAHDHRRAAGWLVQWWRRHGGGGGGSSALFDADGQAQQEERRPPPAGATAAPAATTMMQRRGGWGFDFEWEAAALRPEEGAGDDGDDSVQALMEVGIDAHVRAWEKEREGGGDVSATQEKRREREAKRASRRQRVRARVEGGRARRAK